MSNKLDFSLLLKNMQVSGAVAVLDATLADAKNGKYLRMKISDGKTDMQAIRWSYKGDIPEIGKVIIINGTIGEYNGDFQVNLSNMRYANENDNINIQDFIKQCEISKADLRAAIVEYIGQIHEPKLKEMTLSIINNPIYNYFEAFGAKAVHHNYIGGNAEHSLGTLQKAIAITLSERLPMINRDLIIAGSLLHDIGKCYTYRINGVAIEKTLVGNLLDHIAIGLQVLFAEATIVELDPILADKLYHIISSHHGKLEWGSPTVPQTIEAFIIHQADYIDSHLNTILSYWNTGDEIYTDKIWTQGNVRFLKG